ncbi:cysteine and glycine-rich protein [Coemansia javaensis]|uniref:Cysteine and glycine-rich protein n=1 Tax=Coemansia javaensis TaxID=2761396 RepID=A0A9W8HH32_9FUNG|nr:cysteine and glycine-rich protein [Coemansia javaensis]
MAFVPQAPRCPRCGKSVYAAEEIIGPEGPWHRACFRCRACACRLEITTMVERNSDVYCKACFRRGAEPAADGAGPPANAQPEARYEPARQQTPPPRAAGHVGYGGGGGPSPSSVFSSGRRGFSMPAAKDICPRCAKPIYHAEKVVGPGGPWHRACFKCKQCGTTLSSTKLTEHEGEAFCQTCYTKLFSPRGYNIGGSTEPLPPRASAASPLHGRASANAPSSLSPLQRRDAPDPLSPPSPSRRAWDAPGSSSANPFASAAVAAASAAVGARGISPRAVRLGQPPPPPPQPDPSPTRLSFGRPYKPKPVPGLGAAAAPPDICPRCGGTIYAAEQGIAAGRKYHRRCIKCKACEASISSLQIADRDGDIYCKQCYAKNFGPKGFRPSLGTSINDY